MNDNEQTTIHAYMLHTDTGQSRTLEKVMVKRRCRCPMLSPNNLKPHDHLLRLSTLRGRSACVVARGYALWYHTIFHTASASTKRSRSR